MIMPVEGLLSWLAIVCCVGLLTIKVFPSTTYLGVSVGDNP